MQALSGFFKIESNDMADDNLFYKMGAMYKNGLGTDIDISKAVKYFEKSADKNMWSTISWAGFIFSVLRDLKRIRKRQ